MDLVIVHKDVGNVLTKEEWLAADTHVPIPIEDLWALLSNFAGVFTHENADPTVIQEANDWHLVNGLTEGEHGGGWEFHVGGQLALTAEVDNGDGKTKITCAGHGLIDGDIVSISGSTSYNGVWRVEQVIPPDTFVIPAGWVADEGALTGEHGSHIFVTTVSAVGKYLITYSLSITPVSPNCVLEAATFQNAVQCQKCESQTKLGAPGDYQNVAGQSIEDFGLGDYIGFGVRNITDNGNFVIRNGNLTVVRIG